MTKLRRLRGFSLIELAIALTILVSVTSIAYVILAQGGQVASDAGETYAVNYQQGISEATNSGSTLPVTWTCASDENKVFNLNGSGIEIVAGVSADGTYIFRCTGEPGSKTPSTAHHDWTPAAGGNPATVSPTGGPWEKAF
jgi:prepilin-type N-terminal cleavage/methylation domain-containing protein